MMEDHVLVPDRLYERYLSGVLAGDREACRGVVLSLLDSGTPLLTLYTDLFQRSMYEVGNYWEHNRISVATEHIATSITEHLMSLAYPRLFAHPRTGKSAIVSCVVNEHHQIGGRMVADYFEMQGWDAHFAGANQPVEELLRYIREHQPDIVALSAAIFTNLPKLVDTVDAILACSSKPHIIVGGQAFRWGGASRFDRPPRVTQLSTFVDVERYLKEYHGEH